MYVVGMTAKTRGIDDFLAAYEAEHGEITDEQMEAAYRRGRRARSSFAAADEWRGHRSGVARGNGKQVPVARLLASVDVIPVDNDLGRRVGLLLARTGTKDAIDASVTQGARR
jgi:hypothetical protein